MLAARKFFFYFICSQRILPLKLKIVILPLKNFSSHFKLLYPVGKKFENFVWKYTSPSINYYLCQWIDVYYILCYLYIIQPCPREKMWFLCIFYYGQMGILLLLIQMRSCMQSKYLIKWWKFPLFIESNVELYNNPNIKSNNDITPIC